MLKQNKRHLGSRKLLYSGGTLKGRRRKMMRAFTLTSVFIPTFTIAFVFALALVHFGKITKL